METAESILQFWFGEAADDAEVIRQRSDLWWKKNTEIDEEIRRRFQATLEAEVRGELGTWSQSPHGQLARILLLDQFPRNIYRGTPNAFAYDQRARTRAHTALDQGLDRKIRPVKRLFVYMPFEHSEDTNDQAASVRLFTELVQKVPAEHGPLFKNLLGYALRHKEIVDRFGRFPHRNALLGRASTPEEQEFLRGADSSF